MSAKQRVLFIVVCVVMIGVYVDGYVQESVSDQTSVTASHFPLWNPLSNDTNSKVLLSLLLDDAPTVLERLLIAYHSGGANYLATGARPSDTTKVMNDLFAGEGGFVGRIRSQYVTDVVDSEPIWIWKFDFRAITGKMELTKGKLSPSQGKVCVGGMLRGGGVAEIRTVGGTLVDTIGLSSVEARAFVSCFDIAIETYAGSYEWGAVGGVDCPAGGALPTFPGGPVDSQRYFEQMLTVKDIAFREAASVVLASGGMLVQACNATEGHLVAIDFSTTTPSEDWRVTLASNDNSNCPMQRADAIAVAEDEQMILLTGRWSSCTAGLNITGQYFIPCDFCPGNFLPVGVVMSVHPNGTVNGWTWPGPDSSVFYEFTDASHIPGEPGFFLVPSLSYNPPSTVNAIIFKASVLNELSDPQVGSGPAPPFIASVNIGIDQENYQPTEMGFFMDVAALTDIVFERTATALYVAGWTRFRMNLQGEIMTVTHQTTTGPYAPDGASEWFLLKFEWNGILDGAASQPFLLKGGRNYPGKILGAYIDRSGIIEVTLEIPQRAHIISYDTPLNYSLGAPYDDQLFGAGLQIAGRVCKADSSNFAEDLCASLGECSLSTSPEFPSGSLDTTDCRCSDPWNTGTACNVNNCFSAQNCQIDPFEEDYLAGSQNLEQRGYCNSFSSCDCHEGFSGQYCQIADGPTIPLNSVLHWRQSVIADNAFIPNTASKFPTALSGEEVLIVSTFIANNHTYGCADPSLCVDGTTFLEYAPTGSSYVGGISRLTAATGEYEWVLTCEAEEDPESLLTAAYFVGMDIHPESGDTLVASMFIDFSSGPSGPSGPVNMTVHCTTWGPGEVAIDGPTIIALEFTRVTNYAQLPVFLLVSPTGAIRAIEQQSDLITYCDIGGACDFPVPTDVLFNAAGNEFYLNTFGERSDGEGSRDVIRKYRFNVNAPTLARSELLWELITDVDCNGCNRTTVKPITIHLWGCAFAEQAEETLWCSGYVSTLQAIDETPPNVVTPLLFNSYQGPSGSPVVSPGPNFFNISGVAGAAFWMRIRASDGMVLVAQGVRYGTGTGDQFFEELSSLNYPSVDLLNGGMAWSLSLGFFDQDPQSLVYYYDGGLHVGGAGGGALDSPIGSNNYATDGWLVPDIYTWHTANVPSLIMQASDNAQDHVNDLGQNLRNYIDAFSKDLFFASTTEVPRTVVKPWLFQFDYALTQANVGPGLDYPESEFEWAGNAETYFGVATSDAETRWLARIPDFDTFTSNRQGPRPNHLQGDSTFYFAGGLEGFQDGGSVVRVGCSGSLICSNGGTCTPYQREDGGGIEERCSCPPGWTGATCTVPVFRIEDYVAWEQTWEPVASDGRVLATSSFLDNTAGHHYMALQVSGEFEAGCATCPGGIFAFISNPPDSAAFVIQLDSDSGVHNWIAFIDIGSAVSKFARAPNGNILVCGGLAKGQLTATFASASPGVPVVLALPQPTGGYARPFVAEISPSGEWVRAEVIPARNISISPADVNAGGPSSYEHLSSYPTDILMSAVTPDFYASGGIEEGWLANGFIAKYAWTSGSHSLQWKLSIGVTDLLFGFESIYFTVYSLRTVYTISEDPSDGGIWFAGSFQASQAWNKIEIEDGQGTRHLFDGFGSGVNNDATGELRGKVSSDGALLWVVFEPRASYKPLIRLPLRANFVEGYGVFDASSNRYYYVRTGVDDRLWRLAGVPVAVLSSDKRSVSPRLQGMSWGSIGEVRASDVTSQATADQTQWQPSLHDFTYNSLRRLGRHRWGHPDSGPLPWLDGRLVDVSLDPWQEGLWASGSSSLPLEFDDQQGELLVHSYSSIEQALWSRLTPTDPPLDDSSSGPLPESFLSYHRQFFVKYVDGGGVKNTLEAVYVGDEIVGRQESWGNQLFGVEFGTQGDLFLSSGQDLILEWHLPTLATFSSAVKVTAGASVRRLSCISRSCQNGGWCTIGVSYHIGGERGEVCRCPAGWLGLECEVPDCSSVNNCGTGTCIAPNVCDCPAGTAQPSCDVIPCPPGFCGLSAQGTCSGFEQCTCNVNAGWLAPRCQLNSNAAQPTSAIFSDLFDAIVIRFSRAITPASAATACSKYVSPSGSALLGSACVVQFDSSDDTIIRLVIGSTNGATVVPGQVFNIVTNALLTKGEPATPAMYAHGSVSVGPPNNPPTLLSQIIGSQTIGQCLIAGGSEIAWDASPVSGSLARPWTVQWSSPNSAFQAILVPGTLNSPSVVLQSGSAALDLASGEYTLQMIMTNVLGDTNVQTIAIFKESDAVPLLTLLPGSLALVRPEDGPIRLSVLATAPDGDCFVVPEGESLFFTYQWIQISPAVGEKNWLQGVSTLTASQLIIPAVNLMGTAPGSAAEVAVRVTVFTESPGSKKRLVSGTAEQRITLIIPYEELELELAADTPSSQSQRVNEAFTMGVEAFHPNFLATEGTFTFIWTCSRVTAGGLVDCSSLISVGGSSSPDSSRVTVAGGSLDVNGVYIFTAEARFSPTDVVILGAQEFVAEQQITRTGADAAMPVITVKKENSKVDRSYVIRLQIVPETIPFAANILGAPEFVEVNKATGVPTGRELTNAFLTTTTTFPSKRTASQCVVNRYGEAECLPTYLDGDLLLQIEIDVQLDDGQGTVGRVLLLLLIPASPRPPSGGICSCQPSQGNAGVSEYSVDCSGWQSNEDASVFGSDQLWYEVEVFLRSSDQTLQRQPYLTYDRSLVSNRHFFLPQGFVVEDRNVYITTSISSVSRVETQVQCAVKSFPLETVEDVCATFARVTEAAASGDGEVALNRLILFLNSLNALASEGVDVNFGSGCVPSKNELLRLLEEDILPITGSTPSNVLSSLRLVEELVGPTCANIDPDLLRSLLVLLNGMLGELSGTATAVTDATSTSLDILQVITSTCFGTSVSLSGEDAVLFQDVLDSLQAAYLQTAVCGAPPLNETREDVAIYAVAQTEDNFLNATHQTGSSGSAQFTITPDAMATILELLDVEEGDCLQMVLSTLGSSVDGRLPPTQIEFFNGTGHPVDVNGLSENAITILLPVNQSGFTVVPSSDEDDDCEDDGDDEPRPLCVANPSSPSGWSIDTSVNIVCEVQDPESSSGWSSEGCEQVPGTEGLDPCEQGFILCQCSHLSSFAALLSPVSDGCDPYTWIHWTSLALVATAIVVVTIICIIIHSVRSRHIRENQDRVVSKLHNSRTSRTA